MLLGAGSPGKVARAMIRARGACAAIVAGQTDDVVESTPFEELVHSGAGGADVDAQADPRVREGGREASPRPPLRPLRQAAELQPRHRVLGRHTATSVEMLVTPALEQQAREQLVEAALIAGAAEQHPCSLL